MKKRAATIFALTAFVVGFPAMAAEWGQAGTGNPRFAAGEVMGMATPKSSSALRPTTRSHHVMQSTRAYAAIMPVDISSPTDYVREDLDDAIGNNGDKVPWWKGGAWRNRKRDDGRPYDDTVESRELNGDSRSASRTSYDYDDDMWDDDDDFDAGYSSGSTGGGGSSSSFSAQAQRGGFDDYDDDFDEDDPYQTPSFGNKDDDDSWGPPSGGMTGGGGMVGRGSGAGGRDTFEGDRPGGSLPIPPPGMGGFDDDDDGFDNPFAGSPGSSGFSPSAPGSGFVPGGPGGSFGGSSAFDGGYQDPVSTTATVTSDMGGSFGGTYSAPDYTSGYSSDYSGGGSYYPGSGSLDSGYLDTSVYAQTTTVTDSVVQSSNEGTGSFLSGTPYDLLNYTPPTLESMTGGYTGGYSGGSIGYDAGSSYSGGGYAGGYDAAPVPAPSYGGAASSGSPSFDPFAVDSGQSFDPYASMSSVSADMPSTQSMYQAPPSSDARGSPQFENAVRLVKENRFSEAKTILVSETNRNPTNAAAWRWLADCYYNLLELDDAIDAYQRALERDPGDYYALRGQGFAYLHRGHEYWRRMQEEVTRSEKDAAATTFAHAHDNYKKSLELLGLCLRRASNDGEAIYGEAMAAEGASRKLYSNAISYLKLGPEHRERAELFAENCLIVIDKGIERAKERARQNPGDAGPRALLGGLYLRKAMLYNQLGKRELALIELRNSRDVQQSILDEIDKNNATARKNLREAEIYWERWGGDRQ